MKSYREMTADELKQEKELLVKRYEEYKAMNLSLNMTRGVPATEQLDLTSNMYETLIGSDFLSEKGEDVRNYGVPAGINDIRKVFAEVLGTDIDNIFMGNSSSLNQMFDALMRSMVFGEIESEKPWGQIEGRKWLCPVPGYDRHFLVTETH